MRRKFAVFCLLAGPALALADPALAGNGGLAPVDPESPNAERISDTFWVILAFTGAIFVLVEGLLIAFLLRYRGRGRPRELEGPQVIGHNRLELAWTVAPVLVLVAIGSYIFYKLPGIEDVPSASAAGGEPLTIEVEGRQFYWNYTYPNGVIAVDRMRVPVGRVVKLEITAPTFDVVHSWWIPDLGGKFDAIPGQTNETWFRAREPGVFPGQCAEFCGLQHAVMNAAVEAVAADEFDDWLEEQDQTQGERPEGDNELGRATYRGACAKCHGFRQQGLIGPPLTGATLQNRETIETIVRNGQNQMPAVGKGWEDRQMEALVAYLQRDLEGEQGGG